VRGLFLLMFCSRGVCVTYLTLYRKYRPQRFDEVVGQEHVTRTLQNAIGSGTTAHAYLFCGPRGTGKTTTARILAKTLNCAAESEGPVLEPCGECGNCQDIARGVSFDVFEVDAASHRGIDDIRQISERAQQAATDPSRHSVFIIDEVHQLSRDGASAFLKTLEEPPANVIFVLATTDPEKMISTILSRCQRFDFRPVPLVALIERLAFVCTAEEIEVEPEALDSIARRARGGVRDALSLLEQARALCGDRIGAVDILDLFGGLSPADMSPVLDAIAKSDIGALLRHLDGVLDRGVDVRVYAKELVGYTRDVFLAAAAPNAPDLLDAGEDVRLDLQQQAVRIGPGRAAALLQALGEAMAAMPQSLQPRVDLEVALAGLCEKARAADPVPQAAAGAVGSSSGQGSGAAEPRLAGETEPSTSQAEPHVHKNGESDLLAAQVERLEARLAALTRTVSEQVHLSSSSGSADGLVPPKGMPRPPRRPRRQTGPSAPARPSTPDLAFPPEATSPPSSSEAGAAPEGSAPVGEAGAEVVLNLAMVSEKWQTIQRAIRSRSARFGAYFIDSLPLQVQGNMLTVQFSHAFNRDNAKSEACKQTFTEAVEEVLGTRLRLGAGFIGGEGNAGASPQPPSGDPSHAPSAEGFSGGGGGFSGDSSRDGMPPGVTSDGPPGFAGPPSGAHAFPSEASPETFSSQRSPSYPHQGRPADDPSEMTDFVDETGFSQVRGPRAEMPHVVDLLRKEFDGTVVSEQDIE